MHYQYLRARLWLIVSCVALSGCLATAPAPDTTTPLPDFNLPQRPVPTATPLPPPPLLPPGATVFEGPVPQGASLRLGRGAITDMALSPSGEWLAVATHTGLYLYDPFSLAVVDYLPAVRAGEGIDEVSWSGERLATRSLDNTIAVWDARSGEKIFSTALGGSPRERRVLSFSPDGSQVAAISYMTGTFNYHLVMLDAQSGAVRYEFTTDNTLPNRRDLSIWWSPGGERFFASDILYDSATGTALYRISYQIWAEEVAWSPDGSRIATAQYGSAVYLRDAETGESLGRLQTTLPDGSVQPLAGMPGLAWVGDGMALLAQVEGAGVGYWAVAGTSGAVFSPPDRQARLALSPDKRRVLALSQGVVSIYNLQSGEVLWESPATGAVDDFLWLNDSRHLVTRSMDMPLAVWDTYGAGGQPVAQVAGHLPAATWTDNLAWARSGTQIAVTMTSGIMVWDVNARRPSFTLAGGIPPVRRPVAAIRLAASPTRDLLAISGLAPEQIDLVDLQTGETLETISPATTPRDLAWSPGGEWLAVALDHTYQIWQPEPWRVVQENTVDNTGSRIPRLGTELAWSPDSLWLAIAAPRPDYALARPGLAEEMADRLYSLAGSARAVAWSPDSSKAAVALGDEIVLINPLTQAPRTRLVGHRDRVRRLAWSPAGQQLVSASDDGQVLVWDTEAGTILYPLEGHGSPVVDLAWSPDGSTLATYGEDGTVLLWGIGAYAPPAR